MLSEQASTPPPGQALVERTESLWHATAGVSVDRPRATDASEGMHPDSSAHLHWQSLNRLSWTMTETSYASGREGQCFRQKVSMLQAERIKRKRPDSCPGSGIVKASRPFENNARMSRS